MRRLLVYGLVWFLGTGAVGNASRSFDDANDNIGAATLNVGTGSVYFGVWMKSTEDAAADAVIGRKGDSAATTAGYLIRQNSGDTINVRVADGVDQASVSGTTDIDGVWHHILGVHDVDANTLTLYVDGVAEGTPADNSAVGSLSNAVSFQFGENGGGGEDYNGLAAFGFVERDLGIITNVIMDYVVRPCDYGVTDSACWTLAGGEDPEIDVGHSNRDLTVSGATTSADGPPVMIGGEAL